MIIYGVMQLEISISNNLISNH